MELRAKEGFFTRDREFYRTVFTLMLTVALQNIVSYSVNMVDNIMLGSYSQAALSGAATVNQIFFMVQQFGMSLGEALIVLNAQYWGQKNRAAVQRLTGIALGFGLATGALIFLLCALLPRQLVQIFTNDAVIIGQGVEYLEIIRYTFPLFLVTNILMAALRSVETTKISFYTSIVSLVVNVGINYVLIFGNFGAPEMGVRGAAVGTLAARVVELGIVVVYLCRFDNKLCLLQRETSNGTRRLTWDYVRILIPVAMSQVLWAVSVPMQTAILGHISSDAIAANSVATTFFQYLKVVVVAMSSVCSVMIGRTVGRGDWQELKAQTRTLALLCVSMGAVLGVALFLLSGPLLTLYDLNENTLHLAKQLMVLLSFVMVGMSYQMPVSLGIMRGGGDVKFAAMTNVISTWCIVMPLSFCSAFWWKWPVLWVVVMIQSDQFFKCIPYALRVRRYDKWVKLLTREGL